MLKYVYKKLRTFVAQLICVAMLLPSFSSWAAAGQIGRLDASVSVVPLEGVVPQGANTGPELPRLRLLPDSAFMLAQADFGDVGDDDEEDDEFDAFLQPLANAEISEADRLFDRRYKMLRWHQGFALAALGLLTAQTIAGQILYASQRNFSLAGLGPNSRTVHQILGYTSFSTYSVAMALALAAPSAPERGEKLDAIGWHRILPWVHSSGMMLMPWLGLVTSRLRTDPATNPATLDTLQKAHLAAGYVTWAALAGAMFVIVLD